jgi:hypothetical protein
MNTHVKWFLSLLVAFAIATFLILPFLVHIIPGKMGESLRDYYLSDETAYGLAFDFTFVVMYVYKALILHSRMGATWPLWVTLLGVVIVFDFLFGVVLNWLTPYESPLVQKLQSWFAKTGIAPYLWDVPYFMIIFLVATVIYERL